MTLDPDKLVEYRKRLDELIARLDACAAADANVSDGSGEYSDDE